MSKLRTPEQYRKHYERIKRYRATPGGAKKTYEVNRRSQLRNPNRRQARSKVQYALRTGALTKPEVCVDCGGSSVRIEGHHPDYDKPLEVIWLCTPCHVQIHK